MRFRFPACGNRPARGICRALRGRSREVVADTAGRRVMYGGSTPTVSKAAFAAPRVGSSVRRREFRRVGASCAEVFAIASTRTTVAVGAHAGRHARVQRRTPRSRDMKMSGLASGGELAARVESLAHEYACPAVDSYQRHELRLRLASYKARSDALKSDSAVVARAPGF